MKALQTFTWGSIFILVWWFAILLFPPRPAIIVNTLLIVVAGLIYIALHWNNDE